MRRNKKKNTRLALLCLLLLIGIGFAALAARLKINGSLDVTRTEWDVHFENVEITQGSVTATTAPTSDDTTTTEMTYAVNFTKPGDFYEFTVDIANDGSLDAMVELVSNSTYESDGETPKTLPDYLTSTVTYSDGMEILPNQLLAHNTSEKIKVRVEYKKEIEPSDLPSSADTIIFKFKGDYKQANDDAVPVRVDFSTTSWDDIINAYSNNPSSLRKSMTDGATKEVQLDLDGDGTPDKTSLLRIANLSTPTECSQEGFSQSACGLVIEFADTITSHRMNPSTSAGGWENSDMRAYINSGKYLEGTENEIDYSTSGIYNALPSELRNKIIDTKVVSGHGPNDSKNFTTTDKLYLLSISEIWEEQDDDPTTGLDYIDTAYNQTRQLDYYKSKGTKTSWPECQAAIKQYNGENVQWWTRSAELGWNAVFMGANYSGQLVEAYTYRTDFVSPAFRIG